MWGVDRGADQGAELARRDASVTEHAAMGRRLRVWLPMVRAGTGVDIYTHRLADGLTRRNHDVVVTEFEHDCQYMPWLLQDVAPPPGAEVVVTNSWNGFAFARPGLAHVTVLHLCVHDEVLRPHKTYAQHVFHKHWILPWERQSVACADLLLTVSRDAAAAARRWYDPPEVRSVLNGIDTARFRPLGARRAFRADRPLSLLFVGTLSRRKGADLLLPIMERLGDRAVLRTAGPMRGKSRLATAAGVEHLGVLDEEALVRAYNEADLLLFPSRQEGFGYVAAEAMSCGTPVVASAISSLPEVVPDGRCGRLCPVGDADAFADAVCELAENPDMLQAMSVAAREHARRELGMDRWIGEMESVLLEWGQGARRVATSRPDPAFV